MFPIPDRQYHILILVSLYWILFYLLDIVHSIYFTFGFSVTVWFLAFEEHSAWLYKHECTHFLWVLVFCSGHQFNRGVLTLIVTLDLPHHNMVVILLFFLYTNVWLVSSIFAFLFLYFSSQFWKFLSPGTLYSPAMGLFPLQVTLVSGDLSFNALLIPRSFFFLQAWLVFVTWHSDSIWAP